MYCEHSDGGLQDMTACNMQNTPLCHAYMSILGIIEEVQGIPT